MTKTQKPTAAQRRYLNDAANSQDNPAGYHQDFIGEVRAYNKSLDLMIANGWVVKNARNIAYITPAGRAIIGR